jgi:hypothetical protein
VKAGKASENPKPDAFSKQMSSSNRCDDEKEMERNSLSSINFLLPNHENYVNLIAIKQKLRSLS